MSLKNFVVPKVSVEVPGTDFTLDVRGLSLNDMTTLVNGHRDMMVKLFARFVANKGADLDDSDMGDIAGELLSEAPVLVAHAIALSAGLADERDEVANLSFAVQIEAIERIFELTFGREGGTKKFVETVIRLSQGLASQVQKLRT